MVVRSIWMTSHGMTRIGIFLHGIGQVVMTLVMSYGATFIIQYVTYIILILKNGVYGLLPAL
jgi:hypothetical protein